MIDEHAINTFLHYGYVPNLSQSIEFIRYIDDILISGDFITINDEKALISQGAEILQRAFVDVSGREIVVPISGGLDSRAILGYMLEHVEAHKINTITVGTPGTWDYEIGRQIARVAGTRHVQFDLSAVIFTTALLTSYASNFASPLTFFEGFLFGQIYGVFDKACEFWIGFMGDPLAGSHLSRTQSKSWEIAIKTFSTKHHVTLDIDLPRPGYEAISALPQHELSKSDYLSYDEQLDFAIRQKHYVEPLTLLHGYTHRVPFMYPEWVNFIMKLDDRFRLNQLLYKRILVKRFPILFSLPTKNNFGWPLSRNRYLAHWSYKTERILSRIRLPTSIPPHINYIDFSQSLRNRKDLYTLCEQNLYDLQERNLVDWIHPVSVWKKHVNNSKCSFTTILLLTSLELFLKSRTIK